MEAKKHLRKPENWDTFENLCKKLWGEIWECNEIKKNGRKGQTQNGVDIYGIPKGEKSYYGIQCKGKDDYTHKRLTKDEIDLEIDAAKSFQPPLAKFYIVTTANKDSKIEEYVRSKDLENRQNNLFEVHLFLWEDIVDLIEENKNTLDYYLNINNFKIKSDVVVSFENDELELIDCVSFCELITYFQLGEKPTSLLDYTPYKPVIIENSLFRGKNKSFCRFKLKIKNSGNAPIENPKLIIQAEGEYEKIGDDFVDSVLTPTNARNDVEINETQGNLFICPHRNILTPDEEYISNIVCIKPKHDGSNIDLKWKLVSNNFKKEGVLNIKIDTTFIQKQAIEYVYLKQQLRLEKKIVDYFSGMENE
ncbi:MAG: hypothetical protein WAT92_12790 [Saprospiraceae bacterium]